MSIWTEASGIIRVNDIRLSDETPDFDAIVGRECLWDDPHSVWKEVDENPDAFMPMGSEGSLRKSIWINPEKSHMDAYTITIFGNLRDFSNTQKIVDWFKGVCDKLWVRDAFIRVRCDMDKEDTIWKYGESNEEEATS